MTKQFLSLLLLLGSMGMAASADAHDTETLFNTVNLQAQAEGEIPNDQMLVELVAEHEGSDAAKVAQLINQDMTWALELIKKHTFVKYQTKGYQTWPVYDDDHEISGWHAIQEVEITSVNMEGLSGLIGKLQEKMQVKQMSFSPTDAALRKFEDQLIEEAMQVFRERIGIVGKKMDEKNYRIINLTINTGGYQPPVFYERAMAASPAAAKAPPPAVQAGTSKVVVTVSGSVQFIQGGAE